MPRGDNTVGDKICLEARGTRDLAWITSSSQVSPGKIGHLRSHGTEDSVTSTFRNENEMGCPLPSISQRRLWEPQTRGHKHKLTRGCWGL